ncbi:adenylate kinase 7-like [Periophthalmus magnuspinnatus]|uniref:adenylate kinase 7-like n=1 Tax=Periophthalmus magnuspinnatus TaxID=409849 RepID=UPI002436E8AF|nr:adenylate kinase 7-like [Periophthalmus magnuspinnatus]
MVDMKPKTKRVFVNDVDVFSSKNIAKFLSSCLIEEDEEGEEPATPRGEPAFQIVGTVSSSLQNQRNSGMTEYYVSPTREELLGHLLKCDVILYNISENSTQQMINEATWALTTLHEEMENFKSRKLFILISSVMTWAMTKPQNPDEPDVPISEEQFRRRRPHPAFRAHNELEKLVLKLGRTKKTRLPAYVVSSGLQYGKGENLFHFFFKVSWLMQSPEVPMFGPGTNYIPMIHIHDLGGVIQSIIQNKPKAKYILAVDDSKNTLEEIVNAISTALGHGKVKEFTEQEAISMKAFQPKELDYLKINLSLDASLIKELNTQWTSENGMVENIDNIVEEYKVTRNLLPLKIFLFGPPAVGKTTIAKQLCVYYQLNHIKIEDVIEEKLRELGEPESDDAADAKQEELREILRSFEEDGGLSADEKLLEIVKEKLNSKPCSNQGFVLDGFPHTYEQAQALFSDANPETQESISIEPVYNKKITPDNIFVLNASDEFLIERVQALPESVAEKMHYTQEAFLSRLKGHRNRCAADETLLDYFEELEIYPEEIGINSDDLEYTAALKRIIGMVGEPKNYGPSPEELEAQRLKMEEEKRQRLANEVTERKRRNQATLAEMAAHYQEWKKNLSELERQEQERQSAQSLPLRLYLMMYVMPSLSEAMLECSKVRPEDPVDFLAEYLLRNSTENSQKD